MKNPGPWFPYRRGLLYVLSHCVRSDFLGSGYRFLRYRNGMIRYFWTYKQAQKRAYELNKDRNDACYG
jgi:hypothetical protein